MKLFRATILLILALPTATCAERNDQVTLQNNQGDAVICKEPTDRTDFSDLGKLAVVEWCLFACDSHGYKPARRNAPMPLIADLDLGVRERRIANQYIPAQCLPFNPGPTGVVRRSDNPNAVLECTGVLLKDGRCPD